MKEDLTQADVHEALTYDPLTGLFRWRDHMRGRLRRVRADMVGEIAGWRDPDTEYWKIWLRGKNRLAHRLAWLYLKGEWPVEQIDHRDLDRSNNRWANLRLAEQSYNNGNSYRRSHNTSGFKGVSWSKSRRLWWAQIKCDKVHYNLGYYVDPEEAARAYDSAAARLFGEFARLNFSDENAA